jgi:hypothetical protein
MGVHHGLLTSAMILRQTRALEAPAASARHRKHGPGTPGKSQVRLSRGTGLLTADTIAIGCHA